jgi:fibronectin type 3 domain-containing protein
MVCILLSLTPAVIGLAASPKSTMTLTLTWAASTSTNVASYQIYYGTTSGNYTQIIAAGKVTTATITGLAPGATYYLAATSTDDAGLESLYSNEIVFVVPAERPEETLPELSLLRTGSNSVLHWSTNCPGYTLQWSTSPAGTWTDLTSSPSNSGSYFAYTNTVSAEQQYYRLMR